MSFASDAKNEICALRQEKKCCSLAECYGILLFCTCFSSSEIRIITSNSDFAARLPKLFGKVFGTGFDYISPASATGKTTLLISDRGKIRTVFERFSLEPDQNLSHHINFAVLEEDCCKTAFLRGAFLSGGAVTDPDKHFHLEFSTSHKYVCPEAHSILLDLGFSPRETTRKNSWLLYFKQADVIADLLTLLGAHTSAMGIMTAKVDREMRNSITRKVNCDSANADKIVYAAQAQIDAIHRYAALYGLDSLPEALRGTALLRITNPEASLADLAILSIPPVSKSCLSYRLKKIEELAAREPSDAAGSDSKE